MKARALFGISLSILAMVALCGAQLAFAQTATSTFMTQAEVKAKVQDYFADIPAMIAIAKCESNFRQFADSGNVLHGYGSMVGVYQIDENVHGATALSLGDDINTVDGNLAYARFLYNTSGTDPWISSFSCWGTQANAAQAASPASAQATATLAVAAVPAQSQTQTQAAPSDQSGLTSNLSFGMDDPQVLALQKLLNAKGYPVAATGPGSPGNETTKFGTLTRAAVRKFQCATLSVCSGDEYSTGYGYVDSKTRVALVAAPDSSGAAQISATAPSSAQAAPIPMVSSATAPLASSQAASAYQAGNSVQSILSGSLTVQQQIAQLSAIIADLQAQIAALSKR